MFRVDADGVYPAKWRVEQAGLVIEDTRSRDAIYVATVSVGTRNEIEARRRASLNSERHHTVDRDALNALLQQ